MDGRALLAWNLRELRVKSRLSQEQLAVDAGLDRTYLGGIERGLANPTVAILDRLARALSIEVADLFKVPSRSSPRPKPLPGGRKAR
jgi:transcriptional regulator with XRE-family HTH domain